MDRAKTILFYLKPQKGRLAAGKWLEHWWDPSPPFPRFLSLAIG